ncbi:MAG TPA: uroporphyrinogen decarboxylase family protein [Oscillospiraceae bacterium]|nr:uroporphyrinogen decarboxylase family protein [Oscillospiraceae bacterium]HPS35387.1 uroporphyrinogen decarboxylase family protein [Oscillospiraceae bacterium]
MKTREPDFSQLQKVMRREKPDRPVFFELFISDRLIEFFSGEKLIYGNPEKALKTMIKAYAAGGYDYTSVVGGDFAFPTIERAHVQSVSMRDGIIKDRASFEKYKWPDPENYDYSLLARAGEWMPAGMKLIARGPCGVLENMNAIIGYDNICMMLFDDPDLLKEIVDHIGSRLLKYYEICASYDTVGMFMDNDDWGFNTQTFLSPADMRKYVFPWHKKIVEAAHKQKIPVGLHSCGNPLEVIEDVIGDIKVDARHSYEDKIIPVEEFYKRYHDRIAILGGMDLDFLVRKTPEEIRKRCRAMLEAAPTGYAMGTGNSTPDFLPMENFLAMRDTVME